MMRFGWMNINGFRNVLSAFVASAALAACGGQAAAPASPPVGNDGSTAAVTVDATTAATGEAAPASPTATGMAHDSMNMSAPFDAQFIDSMIVHHQGAIDMAKQAQAEAQRPEIRKLAEDIIKAQQTEIDQMTQWRTAWYPDLKDNVAMPMDMSAMMISADANVPFDIRFINAMIPHHESAIMMAQEAQQKAEHPEIKQLADDIISAQQQEIDQMKQWLAEWTPK